MGKSRLALGILLSALAVVGFASGAQTQWSNPATKDWPTNGGGWANQRYSSLNQINRDTVKSLGGAWSADLGSEFVKGSPIVQGGVLYVAAAAGHIYAIDAQSGQVLWSVVPKGAGISPFNHGLAVAEGKVFIGTGDGSVVALDSKTGAEVWTSYIGDGPSRYGMFVSVAPAVAKGKVIVGLASGDAGIRGRVVALDAATGKSAWQFDLVPKPGEPGNETWPQDNDAWKNGGAGVWAVPAVDPALGIVYLGTGNATPQYGGEIRGGDNLYTATVLALDLDSGKKRWHFQTIHHDIWEADLGAPVVLFDQTYGGKLRKAVAIMRTDGYIFVLDRATGKPIIPVEERPVKQNAKLKTSPTQPFPLGADKLGGNCAEPDLFPPGFKTGCFWDPVDVDQPNTILPFSVRFAPLSFDRATGNFYVAGMSGGYWIRRGDSPYFFTMPSVPGMKSYGYLAAFDSKTDKIVWQKRMPYAIAWGTGLSSTAGGVMFLGEPDGNFQAFDVSNGDKLWEFQTGGNIQSPSVVYEVAGTEYVATVGGSHVWSFKLGGTAAALSAPPPSGDGKSVLGGRIANTASVSMAAEAEDNNLIQPSKFKDEYLFVPQRIKVKVGTVVTWTNTGKESHKAAAEDGSWSTGEIEPGKTGTVKFDKPGTYLYLCKDHPWSFGQVVVTE